MDLDWLTNPEVFAVNRLKAHSSHEYFTPEYGYEQLRISQKGWWKFSYAPNLSAVPADFYKEGFDDSGWRRIQVPGHIQLQGYGNPQYVNTMYPWDGVEEADPPRVPVAENPVGLYVHEFSLPEHFTGHPVGICFEGVESAFYLWLNGVFIGYSEDSFTPAEFDLTPHARAEQNRLCVMVVRYCSGSWLEDQDFWRFSGIFREVFLYTVGDTHIQDLFIKPQVSPGLKEGELRCELELTGKLEGVVCFRLSDPRGDLITDSGIRQMAEHVSWQESLSEIALWSAERPHLYRLEIELANQNNQVVETVVAKVGFRRFEMQNGLMMLNGKRILFKGVNRHEFSAESGRCITKKEIIWDIICMKRNNINAVRTSHYPNQKELYDLCDEYGLYVIDEANIETHGSWMVMNSVIGGERVLPGDHPEWRAAVLDRGNGMLQRDKNHPSILMWSCGNESYGGENLYALSEFFRHTDPSRLVHYEGVFHDRRYNNTSDVESRMYAKPHEIEAYLRDAPVKPYISCEFAHSMGNSTGNLDKYMDLAERYPMYQGGFIWDFIDQALWHTDEQGNRYLAAGGDFGDRPDDGYFCGNGLVTADRKETAKLWAVKEAYQGVIFTSEKPGFMTVKNRFNWLNTKEFSFDWTVLCNGKPVKNDCLHLAIEPGKEQVVPVPFMVPDCQAEYIFQISMRLKEACPWAERGHELAFGQIILKNEAELKENQPPADLIRGDVNLGYQMASATALVWQAQGLLTSLKAGGRELLSAPLRPDFWRAPTDNDLGNGNTRRWGLWKLASLYSACEELVSQADDKEIRLDISYLLSEITNAGCRFTYQFWKNNSFSLMMELTREMGSGDMPVFGFAFEMPKDFSDIRWYGNGPGESYCDRKQGARAGIHESKPECLMADYLRPQECGNLTDIRWIEIMDRRGHGLRLSSEALFECSVLPYTSHQIELARHQWQLPVSAATVVHVKKKQCGVGGDDSWGAPVHPEYLAEEVRGMNFKIWFDIF